VHRDLQHAGRLVEQIATLHVFEQSCVARRPVEQTAALSSIHEAPARAWSLQQLARSAGMSRTAFAQAFKRAVGQSPMGYLSDWRMTLAANKLKRPGATIAEVAPQTGYKSESAFSTAFKRHWGSSPREFVRRSRVPDLESR